MTRYSIIAIAIVVIVCALALWALSPPARGIVKADKLATSSVLIAHPVQLIKIAPAEQKPLAPPRIEIAAAAKEVELPEPKAPDERDLLEPNQPAETVSLPTTATRRHSLSDVCARTGGYKQATHHGRYWHCVYSRR